MNILLINYGGFETNSAMHVHGFANGLVRRGHSCFVAVPHLNREPNWASAPLYQFGDFDSLLDNKGQVFSGAQPDVVHAWTPREPVRILISRLRPLLPNRKWMVHLEDNEWLITQRMARIKLPLFPLWPDFILDRAIRPQFSHPGRARHLLKEIDGVSVIWESLRCMVPPRKPVLDLWPGLDWEEYENLNPAEQTRAELGLDVGTKLLVYSGSLNRVNAAEQRTLYEAVQRLNEAGTDCCLVRTGIYSEDSGKRLGVDLGRHLIDLGEVPRTKMLSLLKAADVLVQPGEPDAFNRFRLPSKIPEFLAMGRPVVLPAANVGLKLKHREEAWVLNHGSAQEIVTACQTLFADPELSSQMGAKGKEFAQRHFSWDRSAEALERFYTSLLKG